MKHDKIVNEIRKINEHVQNEGAEIAQTKKATKKTKCQVGKKQLKGI